MFHTEVFNELISTVIRGLIIPLIPVITALLTALIKKKINDIEEHMVETEFVQSSNIVKSIINTAATAVDQVYISEILKRKTDITREEEKQAFNMVKEIFENIIGENLIDKLTKKYKDIDKWIENEIIYNLNPEIVQKAKPLEKTKMGVMP